MLQRGNKQKNPIFSISGLWKICGQIDGSGL